jgi:hypothetical protein
MLALDWLASRPDTALQAFRSGRAYAALPLARLGVACRQTIEIIAPTGASCGWIDFSIDESRTCDTNDLTLGLDGTVIQQLPSAFEQAIARLRPDLYATVLARGAALTHCMDPPLPGASTLGLSA